MLGIFRCRLRDVSRVLVRGLASLCFSAALLADETPAVDYVRDVRPILERRCFDCHSDDTRQGDVDFAAAVDTKSVPPLYKAWRKAIVQIENKQMPPAEAEQLSDDERRQLVHFMTGALAELESGKQPPDAGPASLHRLNLAEYNRTVRDLMGFPFEGNQTVGLSDESGSAGFGRLSSALTLSNSSMEKYFAAADKVLDRLFGVELNSSVDGEIQDQAKKAREAMLAPLKQTEPNVKVAPRAVAQSIVAKFARRGYRRPVAVEEIDQLMALFDAAERRGGKFEDALRAPLKAVLVSPYFLFRLEADRPGTTDVAIDDHELAARISYFIWSSMPDDVLSDLADRAELAKPEVLKAQALRMLSDPKAKALTDCFAVEWLQLHKLPTARPSTEYFPAFSPQIRAAMFAETTTFFDKLREEDRGVLELLNCDYAYLNEELASYYGIPEVKGQEMRRVPLKAEWHRGGLLGMGSMLASTSHTSRTSPTLRGKWILDVVFGSPPPPPPANASMLKEQAKPGEPPKSFREQMAAHAHEAACAACHRRMDPLGYALENYDAVGVWREPTAERPLDTDGVLPTGEKFNGAAELKQIVWTQRDRFVRNLAEQLLVFALGRELDYYDQPTIKAARDALAANDYKFSALIVAIVESHSFRYRRAAAAPSEATADKQ